MDSEEVDILIQKLMEMPEALYLLYKDNKKGTFIDVNKLIIDRGKECRELVNLGILESLSSKHHHNTPYNYTKIGLNVLNALYSKKIFNGFENIDASSKEMFEATFHKILNDNLINEDEILRDLHFPKINEWIIKNVKYKIEKAKIVSNINNIIEISINICYICQGKTENTFSDLIKVEYYRRKPKQLQNQCKNTSCLLFFNLDSEFHYDYFSKIACEEED